MPARRRVRWSTRNPAASTSGSVRRSCRSSVMRWEYRCTANCARRTGGYRLAMWPSSSSRPPGRRTRYIWPYGRVVVGDAAQAEGADDGVEAGIGEWQGLRVRQAQVDVDTEFLGSGTGGVEHDRAEVDAGQCRLCGIERQVADGADGDLQDAPVCLGADLLAGRAELTRSYHPCRGRIGRRSGHTVGGSAPSPCPPRTNILARIRFGSRLACRGERAARGLRVCQRAARPDSGTGLVAAMTT